MPDSLLIRKRVCYILFNFGESFYTVGFFDQNTVTASGEEIYSLMTAGMTRSIGPGWEISLTLPARYWYLRGFSLEALQKHVAFA
jgi:hypothetical protein